MPASDAFRVPLTFSCQRTITLVGKPARLPRGWNMIFISRNMIFVLCDHVFWFLSIVQSDHCLSFSVLFILFIALYCCRDTEVVICIILAIRKRADGLIYYSSIKHYRRTSETMIGKQWSTLNQNTIANTKVLISPEKRFEKQDLTIL